MSFSTNKYTKPVLLQNLKSINARNYSSYSSFVKAFSPRAGTRSAKIAALQNLLGISTSLVDTFEGNQGLTGSQIKNALIKAVKNS